MEREADGRKGRAGRSERAVDGRRGRARGEEGGSSHLEAEGGGRGVDAADGVELVEDATWRVLEHRQAALIVAVLNRRQRDALARDDLEVMREVIRRSSSGNQRVRRGMARARRPAPRV